jgi:hypothetical protein
MVSLTQRVAKFASLKNCVALPLASAALFLAVFVAVIVKHDGKKMPGAMIATCQWFFYQGKRQIPHCPWFSSTLTSK